MNRFVYDENGLYLRTLSITKFDTFPVLSTDIQPPQLKAGEYAKFVGNSWEVVTAPPEKLQRVPIQATKAQIRIALKRAGKLSELAAYIQTFAANSEERILLEEEPIIRRGGTISNLIRDGLSLTEAQMDTLFTVANRIK